MQINLPPRRHFNEGYDHDEVVAWNACIEEVKRLNPEGVTAVAPSLRDGELIRMANIAAPHQDRDNDMFYIAMGRLVEQRLTRGVGASAQTRSQKMAEAGFTRRPTGKTAGGLMREDDAPDGVSVPDGNTNQQGDSHG